MRRQRRKINVKTKVQLTIIAILVILIIYMMCNPSKIAIVDDYIYRNLADLNSFEREPRDRKLAWDAELPRFVKSDIEYLKEHPEEVKYIKYNFGVNELEIYINKDGEPLITDNGNTILVGWKNFSMYKNDRDLVIYGYSYGSYFDKITLKSDSSKYDWESLTSSKQLPIGEKEGIYGILENEEYFLCSKDEKIYIYHKGEIIAEETIDEKSNIYPRGITITGSDEVYMLYMLLGKNPEIKKIYIGKVDGEISKENQENLRLNDSDLFLPVFKIKNDYCVPVPKDWDTYEKYVLLEGKEPNNPNFEMDLIPFKEVFEYARIKYNDEFRENNRWQAEIVLNLNGKKATYTYYINGYDNRISLSKEDRELETIANNEDEFWKEVYKIRKIYEKYYDGPKE